jgi:hypothetical protein
MAAVLCTLKQDEVAEAVQGDEILLDIIKAETESRASWRSQKVRQMFFLKPFRYGILKFVRSHITVHFYLLLLIIYRKIIFVTQTLLFSQRLITGLLHCEKCR